MRYKISETPTILGKFDTGATVTITLYDLSDESTVTLMSNSCNEVASTGVFRWSTSNITTQPTTKKEYLWIMSDGTLSSYGKLVLGGFPDNMASDVWEELSSAHTTDGTMGKDKQKTIKYIVDGEIPLT